LTAEVEDRVSEIHPVELQIVSPHEPWPDEVLVGTEMRVVVRGRRVVLRLRDESGAARQVCLGKDLVERIEDAIEAPGAPGDCPTCNGGVKTP
jgi:hypothetical protein